MESTSYKLDDICEFEQVVRGTLLTEDCIMVRMWKLENLEDACGCIEYGNLVKNLSSVIKSKDPNVRTKYIFYYLLNCLQAECLFSFLLLQTNCNFLNWLFICFY